MSERQNYHNHIESAIQNVLSKVKSPARLVQSKEEQEQNQTETPVLPSETRPAPRKQLASPIKATKATSLQPIPMRKLPDWHANKQSDQQTEQRSDEKIAKVTEPLTKTGETQATEVAPIIEIPGLEDPVYLEAEDLYTPLSEEDLTPEPDELPLQEDSYIPPYNLFEEFVETELNILLSRYLDLCRCSQCRADIVALALHQLPAYYVTGTRGTLTAKSVIWTRYMQQVMDAVTKGIHIVYKRPRPSCRKIKQVLWLKPEIEEVQLTEPEQALFGALHHNLPVEDLEITFSEEVAELIQALEQSSDEDTADLLPVFSPVVQRSYQQYTPEDRPNLAPDDLQLLDIDDWGSSESFPLKTTQNPPSET